MQLPTSAAPADHAPSPTIFGHPTGLFVLFFAEMWERFSYYGMRALLVFYMAKGFLAYDDNSAYKVYGAYTALVYMAPFFGGLLADRLLGARRAVILGGALMAAGHLLMTVESTIPFFGALALLIVGNGFFKPNISTIVGTLYPAGSSKKDAGFTLFYMGINLGAAMAPLLCGYVGETFGWHYGFGLATVGMLVGLAIFVAPSRVTQVLVGGGALLTAGGMIYLQDNPLLLAVNGFVALALVAAAGVAVAAIERGSLPAWAGQPADPAALKREVAPGFTAELAVYAGALVLTPVVGLLVWSNRSVRVVPDALLDRLAASGSAGLELVGTLLGEISTPAGLLLLVTGVIAFGYLLVESFRAEKVERERLWVVLVLMFFSMLFWAFFEQAGSSINNFTDRNVDRVAEERVVTAAEVGTTIQLVPTQEQLGYLYEGRPLTIDRLQRLQDQLKASGVSTLAWPVDESHVGMGIATSEIPASTFQSANPIYILLFGLVFTAVWGWLGARGLEPSTPVKFAAGLLQLGLGFGALWYGAQTADARGMVDMSWLLLGYLLHTTGELCLSPVGLSMVVRLSPPRIVSTTMGAWFLATAFSSYLAAIIATFTGVGHGEEGGGIPVPAETVHVYGDVFGQIGVAAVASAVVLLLMSPLLNKWAHGEG